MLNRLDGNISHQSLLGVKLQVQFLTLQHSNVRAIARQTLGHKQIGKDQKGFHKRDFHDRGDF